MLNSIRDIQRCCPLCISTGPLCLIYLRLVCLKQQNRTADKKKTLQPITTNSTIFIFRSLCNFNLASLLSRGGRTTSTGRDKKVTSAETEPTEGRSLRHSVVTIRLFLQLCEGGGWTVESKGIFYFNSLGQHLLGSTSELHSHSLMLHMQG